MDMQNVSNLQIPEGVVRTIHDKDNRLIWGRLNYDTKYAGDTSQQTYTGKNLFNKNLPLFPTSTTSNITVEVLETGIKVQQIITSTANLYATYILGDFSSFAGQSVTLSCNIFTSGQNIARLALGYCKSDGSSRSTRVYIYASSGQTTLQLSASELAERPYLYIYAYSNAGGGNGQAGDYVEYTNLQLEFGSTATSYEPYVGGIPAPNPDYPQPINVVTGTQTVTITGGTVSNNFTLNLGALELCKIGAYQDYIYKSSDDWYVHKGIGKVIFNGTENWTLSSNYTNNSRFTCQDIIAKHPSPSPILSNYFTEGVDGTDTQNICVNGSSGKIMVTIANSKATTAPELTTWFSTHNTIVYYVLATTTDTKITNDTLITQLNAIHEWMTRYGYTATVSGTLPLIISKTDLS